MKTELIKLVDLLESNEITEKECRNEILNLLEADKILLKLYEKLANKYLCELENEISSQAFIDKRTVPTEYETLTKFYNFIEEEFNKNK